MHVIGVRLLERHLPKGARVGHLDGEYSHLGVRLKCDIFRVFNAICSLSEHLIRLAHLHLKERPYLHNLTVERHLEVRHTLVIEHNDLKVCG